MLHLPNKIFITFFKGFQDKSKKQLCMKQKITLALLMVGIAISATAQNSRYLSSKKGDLFGVHVNAYDITTPLTFKSSSTNRTFTNLRDMDFGFSLSYWKGLTNTIDFSTRAGILFHDYLASDRGTPNNKSEFGAELEPTLNFRPYGDNSLIAPFLTAGIGGGYYTDKFGAYAPVGVGIQANFNSLTYMFVQAQYRFTLTDKVLNDALLYSLGFAQNIGRITPPPPPAPPIPIITDRDGDGVLDADDKCPDTPGLASLMGCPDRDGDYIADGDDACPDVAGTAKYNGCPVPDTDGDGINDELDACPTVPGVAKYKGCPIPDTDGDGVNDEEDKCPSRPGPASNQGCPEIAKEVIEKVNFAAKNVFFSTGSFKLLAKSNKSLDGVADLMKADQSLMLDIDGHTDSQGSDEMNHTLSHNRATAVKDYLVSRGVSESRMTVTGYGEEKPVADNNTAAGRAKNRRTEMTVRNF